jgi:endonuclease G
MKKGIMIIGIIIAVLFGLIFSTSQDSDSVIDKEEFSSIKSFELPSYIEDATVLKKHGFTIGFSKKYRHAYWVAYKFDCSETKGEIPRSNYFREDQILGKYSPSTDDYYASGYDKGHLIPAADNKSDSLSMHDSFLMSNVSPQIPEFNRGIWKVLEEQVRDWACEYDSLYIITGAILNPELTRLGKNKVAIPDYYYKSILLYGNNNQSIITYYMYQYSEDDNLNNFVITTDSLESILGYDLFHNLDDSVEAELESKIDTTFWKIK